MAGPRCCGDHLPRGLIKAALGLERCPGSPPPPPPPAPALPASRPGPSRLRPLPWPRSAGRAEWPGRPLLVSSSALRRGAAGGVPRPRPRALRPRAPPHLCPSSLPLSSSVPLSAWADSGLCARRLGVLIVGPSLFLSIVGALSAALPCPSSSVSVSVYLFVFALCLRPYPLIASLSTMSDSPCPCPSPTPDQTVIFLIPLPCGFLLA